MSSMDPSGAGLSIQHSAHSPPDLAYPRPSTNLDSVHLPYSSPLQNSSGWTALFTSILTISSRVPLQSIFSTYARAENSTVL